LLDLVPVETIAQSVIAGDYHFPADLVEEVYTRRRIVPTLPEEPPPEDPAALWPEMPLGRKAEPMPPPELDVRPVRKIGLLVPASGRLESFGARVRRGVALALKIHGTPPFPYRVEVVEVDEKGDLEGLAPLLSDENLEVLIGPLTSTTVERIVLAAEENGLAVFSPTASSSRLAGISPNFFRNCLTLEEFGAGLARFGVEVLGVRTFVALVPDDSYGHRYAEIFGEELEKLGGSVLAVESYDGELTDYAKPIGTLKKAIGMPDPLPEPAKGREAGFEPYVMPFGGIFLPGSAEEAGLIVPQLSFHDIDVRQLAVLGGNGLNTPVFPERGEEFSEGAFFIDAFFAGGPDRAVQNFVRRYREVHGEEPDTFAAQAYDAAAMIIELMGQGVAGRGAMLSALGSVADFPGVTGPTTLYPGGYVVRPPRFGTVFKGHLVSAGRWESAELP
jgi:branched-chain amino acid transport system substrate-binding protein